ncbi:MAG: hypothetical protein HQL49_03030 [Gammaproteobacteria bacterium]|nr:hypothetical protein [Gammaproteobacteria bacterium]
MSIRTFLFCDICNHDGVRIPDYRRSDKRNTRSGRRITDGRRWLEVATPEAALSSGWVIDASGRHICPDCREIMQRHQQEDL